jgi:hypothetical protein
MVAHEGRGAKSLGSFGIRSRLSCAYLNGFPGIDENFHTNSYLSLDQRITFFLIAYSASPAMTAMIVGGGAKYPSTLRDADGDYLTGGRSYWLHLPQPTGRVLGDQIYNPVDGTMIDAASRSPASTHPTTGSAPTTTPPMTSTSDPSVPTASTSRTGSRPTPARATCSAAASVVRPCRSLTRPGSPTTSSRPTNRDRRT